MNTEQTLAVLAILVSFIGVAFGIFAFVEYWRLARLRKEISGFREELAANLANMQKAMQRVLSSYSETDPDKKIRLLREAVAIYPEVFNGYNSLGYAYLDQKKIPEAIDAFKDAIRFHPNDKAGYFDLAHAYLKQGNKEFCLNYLKQAIKVDPDSKSEITDNPLFEDMKNDPELIKLTK